MNPYHLSAVISFIRHGEKDIDGNLTEKGLRQAIQRGLQLKNLKGNIYLHHSGVGRVKKTALAISNFIEHQVLDSESPEVQEKMLKYISGSDEGTGMNHPEETLDELHYVFDKNKPSTYFKSWIPVDAETATVRAQEFLNYKDKSPEPETTPSPKQMAQRVAKTLLNQLETSISTSYEVKENYINTTHEPVLLSALFYFLSDFSPHDKDFVAQIGGSVDFAEGFDINVYQTAKNEKLIFLDFREFLVPLDIKTIKLFVHE